MAEKYEYNEYEEKHGEFQAEVAHEAIQSQVDRDQEVENTTYGEVKRDLKSRHLQMIAIGGTIGTGIFLSSGGSVAAAGPLGALIAYTIVGIMVYFVCTSLGEMSAYIPLPGAFTTFGSRFVDPALGFALGIGYAFQWIITVAIEVVAAGAILQYWAPNLAMWIPAVVFIVVLVLITLIGVKAFGELEYWFALIKVITCVVFIIVGILVDVGALGDAKPLGSNWHIEGAPIVGETAREQTLNIFSTCVWAFFSFGGCELVGLTAGESSNPRKAVPKAIRQTFWRILLFYILSLIVIGLCIPYTDENLFNAAVGSLNEAVPIAPFTLVFQMAKIKYADHIVNAVLLTAVLSAGQSSFYASTRTLMAMGREGKMPKIFGRVNSRGVPIAALILVTLVACIGLLADLVGTGVVFTWLVNLTGMSALLTWLSISIIHLRFRAAFKAQGRSLSDLPYLAPFFPYSCYLSIALALVIVVMEGYGAATADPFDVVGVVAVFIGAPVFFLCIIGWKIYHKTKLIPLLEVDLDSGRPSLIVNRDQESKIKEAKRPWWKKAVKAVA